MLIQVGQDIGSAPPPPLWLTELTYFIGIGDAEIMPCHTTISGLVAGTYAALMHVKTEDRNQHGNEGATIEVLHGSTVCEILTQENEPFQQTFFIPTCLIGRGEAGDMGVLEIISQLQNPFSAL